MKGQAYKGNMRNKVQILAIKKNIINIKVKSSKQQFLIPLCLASIAIFMLCFSVGGTSLKEVGSSIAYIYNPVNSLYSDNSSIVFASVGLIDKESLDFTLPMSGCVVDVLEHGDISLLVNNSIMVKATESGVVEDVGITLDGVKYIKIKHSVDMSSVVENVDIVGVKKGDIVKRGQDIATAKTGEKVVLKLFMLDNQISKIKLNQSKIVWEN